MSNIDDILNKEAELDCGDDKLCQQNQNCLMKSDSYECSMMVLFNRQWKKERLVWVETKKGLRITSIK